MTNKYFGIALFGNGNAIRRSLYVVNYIELKPMSRDGNIMF